MARNLRILSILAHPDDETLGLGGTLAKYAAEGAETHLLTATRGEKGWFGDLHEYPGPEALGRIREGELHASAEILGLQSVTLLDYVDGELDRADPGRIIDQIAAHIRRIRPDIVITFGPDGLYGHPDHIAISQFTTAAVVAAATPHRFNPGCAAHRTQKLYYRVGSARHLAAYEAVFGALEMGVDGICRRANPWPDWMITTRIDSSDYWPQVWEAVQCHRSQLPAYERLQALSPDRHRYLWGTQELYRAMSLSTGGRAAEFDLREGVLGVERVHHSRAD